MNFKRHFNLDGTHAAFSPSQSSWLRYSDDRIVEVYLNKKAAEMGTKLHKWVKDTIDLGIKQPRSQKTIYAYVNDAIGYRMNTEVVLYYSDLFFGTADAIAFRNNFLRIHDLKTGKTPVKMEQLLIYAALFCLEYNIKPTDIGIELRIYQSDDIEYRNSEEDPDLVNNICHVMDRIIHLNDILKKVECEEV